MPDGIPFEIVEKLDSDEAKVVQLIVAGMTAKEISSSLKVSVRTYHYRKKMIFQKLNGHQPIRVNRDDTHFQWSDNRIALRSLSRRSTEFSCGRIGEPRCIQRLM